MRNVLSFHKYLTPISSIELDKSAIYFSQVWDTEQITATYLPVSAFDGLTWSSSNTSVATVSQSWLVTCVSLGNCTITCSAQRWDVSATCDVVKVTEVTMTNTWYYQWASYASLSETLFTALATWYYHITWQFYANQSSSWATWATHSLSWWTKISWVDSWWTDPYQSIDVDCIYYIEAWTELKWNVSTYWYTNWWWRNFAAQYYWDYNPAEKTYSYSYDFANKSISDMQDDWWTLKTASWVSSWDNWVMYSWWNYLWNSPTWLSTAISNANVIIIKSTHTQRVNWTLWLTKWNSDADADWFAIYWDASVVWCSVSWTQVFKTSFSPSVQQHTAVGIFNLNSKTAYVDYDWIYTNTVSLTDAQIAFIKTTNTLGHILENNRFKSISIEII